MALGDCQFLTYMIIKPSGSMLGIPFHTVVWDITGRVI